MKNLLSPLSTPKNAIFSCLGIVFVSMFMASCGDTDTSNSSRENCIESKGSYDWDGNLISCKTDDATTTTILSATTTTIEETANWDLGDTGDSFGDSLNAFVAPFVQPVCDTLRLWKPPAETTKKEFDDFSKQVARLKKAIGSPSKPTFKDTYWAIYTLAEGALDHERKYPNDKYGAFTASYGPRECDRLNFTTANSKFGVDVTDTIDSESTTPPSSATNTPEKPKTITTQKPANSAVMLSSANIKRLKQECKQNSGCSINYRYFEAYINDNKDYDFSSSSACMSYFRDMMNAIGSGNWETWQDWESVNQSRCFVMAD